MFNKRIWRWLMACCLALGLLPVLLSAQSLPVKTGTLHYETGNAHFHGKTIFIVTDTGGASLSFERGMKQERYEGHIGAKDLEQLFSKTYDLMQSPPVFAQRSGKPDESRTQLQWTQGELSKELVFWSGERFNAAALNELIQLLEQQIKKISGGKVKY